MEWPRLNIADPTPIVSHRAGWGYVLGLLDQMHDSDGILVVDFVERRFSWGLSEEPDPESATTKQIFYEGQRYPVPLDHVRLIEVEFTTGSMVSTHAAWIDPAGGTGAPAASTPTAPAAPAPTAPQLILVWDKLASQWARATAPLAPMATYPAAYLAAQPLQEPWVGFWHNPPGAETYRPRDACHAPEAILSRAAMRDSLPWCRGIWVFSDFFAGWLAPRVAPVPVSTLMHPTEVPPHRPFAFRPHVVQIGYWLRDPLAIWRVPLPPGYRRTWLYGTLYALESHQDLLRVPAEGMQRLADGKAYQHRVAEDGPAVTLARLADAAYDRLLSEAVALLDVRNSSCNNAVVECLVRGTPLVVNRHPAVVEYLGPDYPLYYDSGDWRAAGRLLADPGLLRAAVRYMDGGPWRERVTGHRFLKDLAASAVAQGLLRRQVDAVVTWVNGDDPAWRAAWNSRQAEIRVASTSCDSCTPNRYRNHGELELCLASILRCGCFQKVFLVVSDEQRVPRYATAHGRVRVVRHSEIFPDPGVLPNFNSLAIESCLHFVPGLAEHFVYFNDDMVLRPGWRLEHLFREGPAASEGQMRSDEMRPVVYQEDFELRVSSAKPSSFERAWAAAHRLLDRVGAAGKRNVLAHAPQALTKHQMRAACALVQEEVEAMRGHRVRQDGDFCLTCGFAQYFANTNASGVRQLGAPVIARVDSTPGVYSIQDDGQPAEEIRARLAQIRLEMKL